jgi:N-acetylglucosamine transport system permease protein
MSQKLRKNLFLIFLLAPSLILFSLFIIYPTIRTFVSSLFLDTGLGSPSKFVGFENFIKMFHDHVFFTSLKNTVFLLVIVAPCTLLLALFFAAVLTTGKIKERNVYRTILFFPSILSLVSVGILWSFIFHPTMGILNSIFGTINPPILGSKKTVMFAIAVTMIWQAAGYYMVMYIASIDSISKEIYEAADIDGVNGWQKFWKITIPQLHDILSSTIIYVINGVLTISFSVVNVMTDGGPNRGSEVLTTYMYKQAMNSNFGYAMAIAVFTFAISIIFSLISNRIINRHSEEIGR